jgi:hypothetical protein
MKYLTAALCLSQAAAFTVVSKPRTDTSLLAEYTPLVGEGKINLKVSECYAADVRSLAVAVGCVSEILRLPPLRISVQLGSRSSFLNSEASFCVYQSSTKV